MFACLFLLFSYKTIVCYKTAYYSFYLPLACGMILAGLTSDVQLEAAKSIAVELGEKFQIQVYIQTLNEVI